METKIFSKNGCDFWIKKLNANAVSFYYCPLKNRTIIHLIWNWQYFIHVDICMKIRRINYDITDVVEAKNMCVCVLVIRMENTNLFWLYPNRVTLKIKEDYLTLHLRCLKMIVLCAYMMMVMLVKLSIFFSQDKKYWEKIWGSRSDPWGAPYFIKKFFCVCVLYNTNRKTEANWVFQSFYEYEMICDPDLKPRLYYHWRENAI